MKKRVGLFLVACMGAQLCAVSEAEFADLFKKVVLTQAANQQDIDAYRFYLGRIPQSDVEFWGTSANVSLNWDVLGPLGDDMQSRLYGYRGGNPYPLLKTLQQHLALVFKDEELRKNIQSALDSVVSSWDRNLSNKNNLADIFIVFLTRKTVGLLDFSAAQERLQAVVALQPAGELKDILYKLLYRSVLDFEKSEVEKLRAGIIETQLLQGADAAKIKSVTTALANFLKDRAEAQAGLTVAVNFLKDIAAAQNKVSSLLTTIKKYTKSVYAPAFAKEAELNLARSAQIQRATAWLTMMDVMQQGRTVTAAQRKAVEDASKQEVSPIKEALQVLLQAKMGDDPWSVLNDTAQNIITSANDAHSRLVLLDKLAAFEQLLVAKKIRNSKIAWIKNISTEFDALVQQLAPASFYQLTAAQINVLLDMQNKFDALTSAINKVTSVKNGATISAIEGLIIKNKLDSAAGSYIQQLMADLNKLDRNAVDFDAQLAALKKRFDIITKGFAAQFASIESVLSSKQLTASVLDNPVRKAAIEAASDAAKAALADLAVIKQLKISLAFNNVANWSQEDIAKLTELVARVSRYKSLPLACFDAGATQVVDVTKNDAIRAAIKANRKPVARPGQTIDISGLLQEMCAVPSGNTTK